MSGSGGRMVVSSSAVLGVVGLGGLGLVGKGGSVTSTWSRLNFTLHLMLTLGLLGQKMQCPLVSESNPTQALCWLACQALSWLHRGPRFSAPTHGGGPG